MHATDSQPLDEDEPFTVDLDMFEILDCGVDGIQSEPLPTAGTTMQDAGDDQAHEIRSPSTPREDNQPIPPIQNHVHWQDDDSDEDVFATALEELEAWVQSGAVEIIPDD